DAVQVLHRLGAWHAGLATQGRGRRVRVREAAVREHVGGVADARAGVIDRAGRDTELLQPEEAADAGAVLADAGIVEQCRANAGPGEQPRGESASVRAADDD